MRAILMYHSIDPSGSPISLDAEIFRSHVRWLAGGRVRVVPLAEIESGDEDADAVAITFDDGFVNFNDVAAPLLLEHGLPVTLFVVSDEAGRTNAWGGRAQAGIPTLPLLDWPALARLAEAGVELGGHTRTHPPLAGLDPARVADEVGGGAERIASETGRRPVSFAYPYGSHDGAAVAAVAAVFARACTTKLSILGPEERPHLLPRLDMYYYRRPGTLEAWGSAGFRWRLGLRSGLRRVREAVRPAGRNL